MANTKEKILIDKDDASNSTYIGRALSGTEENQARWSITKIVEDDSGNVLSIMYSGGNGDQVHKWAERKTLEYK